MWKKKYLAKKWGIDKLNRDKLEILQPNNYLVPEGYFAFALDDIVVVKKKPPQEIKYSRCKDCSNFMVGRSARMGRFDRYVCKKKKKEGFNFFTLKELYEQVKMYDLACPMFAEKKAKKST